MVQAYGYSDFRQEVNLKEIVILLSCVYIPEEREFAEHGVFFAI